MSNNIQSGARFHSDSKPLSCEQCEELIYDLTAQDLTAQDLTAQDLTAPDLTPRDLNAEDLNAGEHRVPDSATQAAFDRHLSSCVSCSRLLADSQRGAAWLDLLKTTPPEPPSDLVERILASTSGTGSVTNVSTPIGGMQVGGIQMGGLQLVSSAYHPTVPAAAAPRGKLLAFPTRFVAAFNTHASGRGGINPRLAMTAAMAFFSISLTMNMLGIRIGELKSVSTLNTASLQRSFYEADASVIRSFSNLRVVYEVESRVQDLKKDSAAPAASAAQPNQQDSPSQTPAPQSQPQSQPRSQTQPSTVTPDKNSAPDTSQHITASPSYLLSINSPAGAAAQAPVSEGGSV